MSLLIERTRPRFDIFSALRDMEKNKRDDQMSTVDWCCKYVTQLLSDREMRYSHWKSKKEIPVNNQVGEESTDANVYPIDDVPLGDALRRLVAGLCSRTSMNPNVEINKTDLDWRVEKVRMSIQEGHTLPLRFSITPAIGIEVYDQSQSDRTDKSSKPKLALRIIINDVDKSYVPRFLEESKMNRIKRLSELLNPDKLVPMLLDLKSYIPRECPEITHQNLAIFNTSAIPDPRDEVEVRGIMKNLASFYTTSLSSSFQDVDNAEEDEGKQEYTSETAYILENEKVKVHFMLTAQNEWRIGVEFQATYLAKEKQKTIETLSSLADRFVQGELDAATLENPLSLDLLKISGEKQAHDLAQHGRLGYSSQSSFTKEELLHEFCKQVEGKFLTLIPRELQECMAQLTRGSIITFDTKVQVKDGLVWKAEHCFNKSEFPDYRISVWKAATVRANTSKAQV